MKPRILLAWEGGAGRGQSVTLKTVAEALAGYRRLRCRALPHGPCWGDRGLLRRGLPGDGIALRPFGPDRTRRAEDPRPGANSSAIA